MMTNPLRSAIGASFATSGGGPSWCGGSTRAGAGWPTVRMKPSNCMGENPTRARVTGAEP